MVFSALLVGCKKPEGHVSSWLRISSLSALTYVDPQKISNDSDHKIIYAAFEGLIVPDPETMQPLPGVAERWVISPDGKTYEFFLRDNAKWSDGSPVIADDFVYAAKRALSSKLSCAFVELFFPVRNAKAFFNKEIRDFSRIGICAVNSRTLRIELEERTPCFLMMLMHPCWFPLNDSVVKSLKRYNKDLYSQNVSKLKIVSNGPFFISERIPGSRLLLNKNMHYWDSDNVLLSTVVFYFDLNLSESIKMFHEKELDVVEMSLDNDGVIHDFSEESELVPSPLFECSGLALNTTRSVCSDKRIRIALSLAIDREKLLDRIDKNKSLAAYGFVPPVDREYTAKQLFRHDVDLARKLLGEAGYPSGKGIPVLSILCNESELGLNTVVVEQVSEDWRNTLGIDSKIDSRDLSSFIDHRKKMHFDAVKISYGGTYCDPTLVADTFTSGSIKNYGKWSDPRYDEIVRGIHQAMDSKERGKLVEIAEAYLAEEMPIIPLFFGSKSYLIDSRVRGWFPSAINIHPLKFVYFDH
jgi:oligopeptide transport system substrate-binding protein